MKSGGYLPINKIKMTPKQEAILAALTIVPKCILNISLKTKIPSKEVGRMLDALAQKGAISKYTRRKEMTYSALNPRTQKQNAKK